MATSDSTPQTERPEAYYFDRPPGSASIDQLVFALAGVCQTLDQAELSSNDAWQEIERINNLHVAAAILSHQLMTRLTAKPATKRQIEAVRKYHRERFGPDWPDNTRGPTQ
jgi:hypothetical protein